jgi:tetratricopeptide (TPR) repeat protein
MSRPAMTLNVRKSCVISFAVLLFLFPARAGAADQWLEMKSPHFTVLSNASERSTRNLVWQMEQMRSAMVALLPWAKPDLNKPLGIVVLKDENSMRALAPEYWEKRGAIKPASLWLSGPDQHYLVIRTDVESEEQGTINPYWASYFSYVGLVIDQSVDHDIPFWLRRGFTAVLSNTIVREDYVSIGPIIPWHLKTLRERARLTLPQLMAVTPKMKEVQQSTFMEVFDAQSWAFVHFLIFGDDGKRSGQLAAYEKLVADGKDPAAAFTESFGSVEPLLLPFNTYIDRSVFSYKRYAMDVSVQRERFPVRQLTPAEAAGSRALFHAAMGRPVEARAAIGEARKADPNSAASYTAEALLFDQERKVEDAKAAYAKAVELGTSSAYAHYRLASLTWQRQPSAEILAQVDALLLKAIERNTRYGSAYAWLGEIRAFQGTDADAGLGLIRRAISLEPTSPQHRLRAANVLLNQRKPGEARAQAQAALTLADDDVDRKRAQEMLELIAKAGEGK